MVSNQPKYFFGFIRLSLTFFASFLCVIGYLLFNPISFNLIFVFLSSFFLSAGIGAYNNIIDKNEDTINRKGVNPLVKSNSGLLIVIICVLLGGFFVFYLSYFSIFFYVSSTITGTVYSSFRLKHYFLIKNLYSGLGAPQIFLLGSSAIQFSIEYIPYYFLISFFIFIGSLISDLRDYKGDKSIGIRTLPIRLGYEKTRKIVYFLLTIFSIFIIVLNLYNFFILLPFITLMFLFVIKNRPAIAHICGGFSLITLTVWLMI